MSDVKSKDKKLIQREKFSKNSLTERIGSFQPRTRKDRGVNRKELKIQQRTSRLIYSKRTKLAQSLIDSPYDSLWEKTSAALVSNQLSPTVYDGWYEYIKLLVIYEGGWEEFRTRLIRELEQLEYFRNKYLIHAFWIVIVFLFSVILRNHLVEEVDILSTGLYSDIAFWFPFALLAILAASILIHDSLRIQSAKEECIGVSKKDPGTFVTRSHAKSLSS